MIHAHSHEAGRACTDGGDGTCSECGVALVECIECNGVGYHEHGCSESEEA